MSQLNVFAILLSTLVITTTLQSRGESSYVEILRSLTRDKKNIVTEIPYLQDLLQSQSIEEAQDLLQQKTLSFDKTGSPLRSDDVQALIRKRTLTIVVVPGLLGEFIDVRAFEEIFARPSQAKKQWESISQTNQVLDQRFVLETMKTQTEKLSNLIDVASIDDVNGNPLIKVVLLKTLLGSLESVGSMTERAQVFNRRLQTYIDLTKDQNIVLLGYSRGTPLALEMLIQAQDSQLSYFSRVKSLVSYAGVISGSSLADDTDNPHSSSGIIFQAVKDFHSSLQTANGFWDSFPKRFKNASAFAKLISTISAQSPLDPKSAVANATSGDFESIANLIVKIYGQLGLKDPRDFNGHVNRMKLFITEVLKSVHELKTRVRTQWWQTHQLPKGIQYRSLVAVMVDPNGSSSEKLIFDSKEGYSDSLDDRSLLGNMQTYKALTGVALNDSQVAVHQSLFLPEIIARSNPSNTGLDIKSLGTLQTHHWGVALPVVNKMSDGRINPFPREKVLLALAAYLNQ